MKSTLKPLDQQTVVITGASSGIGLATARRLGERGANLVLAARNTEALERIAEDLRGYGVRVETVTAAVVVEAEVRRIAEVATARFGGCDTWVDAAAAVRDQLLGGGVWLAGGGQPPP